MERRDPAGAKCARRDRQSNGGYTGCGESREITGEGHHEAHHHLQARGFDDYFGFLVGGHNYLLHREAEAKFGSAHSHDLIYRGRKQQQLDGYQKKFPLECQVSSSAAELGVPPCNPHRLHIG
jgi:hypothetical protein